MQTDLMDLTNISKVNTSVSESLNNSTKDFWIIEGILENSDSVVKKIYQLHFSKIEKLVWSFKNLVLNAEDVFQEGITRAIINIREGKFRGESSFSTYLYAICRNICRAQLQNIAKIEQYENQLIEEEDNRFELLKLILDVKSELGDKCKEIIDIRFSMVGINHDEPNKCTSFDTIAERLNITSVNARQRFKRCLDQLRLKMAGNPDFEEYF